MSLLEREGEPREPHFNFAQALVQLARDYGVSSFEGSFRLGWEHREAGWDRSPVKINWSEGRHGDDSKIGLRTELFASLSEIAPNSDTVPSMTYAREGNFYELSTCKGKGQPFWERWRHRILDFPQSREAAFARCSEDTQAWLAKRFPELAALRARAAASGDAPEPSGEPSNTPQDTTND